MKSKSSVVSLLVAATSVLFATQSLRAETPAYLDGKQPLEARVEDLLGRPHARRKIQLCHADSKFTSAAIPRLGIPRRWLSDGPHGVRKDVGPDTWDVAGRTDDFATALPASICLAATWNPELAQQTGQVIGRKPASAAKDIMLGPGVNILQCTHCAGGTLRYYGEDPFLAGRMAVGYIKGVQSQGVASCVKHFAANNQETDRSSINVEMDERTLREIYLPAFKAAVQGAKVWTIMGGRITSFAVRIAAKAIISLTKF